MRKKDRSDILYLEDLLTSMGRIAEYIKGYNFIKFKLDPKTVDAVIRNFEIIGEASKNVSDKIKSQYPEVPWDEMYYLRNRVMHEYFGIDYEIIWDLAKNNLPENYLQIDRILINRTLMTLFNLCHLCAITRRPLAPHASALANCARG